MTEPNLPREEPRVKDRILELLASGMTAADIADALGTSPQYVGRVAARAGVSVKPTRRGALRNTELVVLSPWHAAVGRWIGRQLAERYLDHKELGRCAHIPAQRLLRAEIGCVDLTMRELMRLSVEFGEAIPPMTTNRPKMAAAMVS